jgi:hypothetical protein
MSTDKDNQNDNTLPEGQGAEDQETAGSGAPAAKRRPSRALIAWLAVVLPLVVIGFVLAGLLLLGSGPSLFSRRCVVDAPQGGQCARVYPFPGGSGQMIDCLPPGTEVKVFEDISGEDLQWYQIVSYAYDSGPLEVTGVSPGGPADEAGLHVGDVVLQIDDMDMSVTPLNVASGYLRERVGQSVTLVAGRNGGEVVLNVVPCAPSPGGGGSLDVGVKGGLFQGDVGYIGARALLCD